MSEGLIVEPISVLKPPPPNEQKKQVRFDIEVDYREKEKEVKKLLQQSTLLSLSKPEQAKSLAGKAIQIVDSSFPEETEIYRKLMCRAVLSLCVLLPIEERKSYAEKLKALGFMY